MVSVRTNKSGLGFADSEEDTKRRLGSDSNSDLEQENGESEQSELHQNEEQGEEEISELS